MKNTIYLVDDDPDDRIFIRQALLQVKPGMNVVEVASGLELLALMQQENQPYASLILMDMNMPKMSGLETIKALTSDQMIRPVPVVMISTTTNPSYIKSAYEAGAVGFICKPTTLKGFTEMAHELTSSYF